MNNLQADPGTNPAKSIRYCLSYLLADAIEANLQLPALHIKLAIMELDEIPGDDEAVMESVPEEPVLTHMAAE